MFTIVRSIRRNINKNTRLERANRYQWDTRIDEYSDNEEELLDYEFAGVDDYEEEELIKEFEALGYDLDNLDAGPGVIKRGNKCFI
jgi:hypothetical protein